MTEKFPENNFFDPFSEEWISTASKFWENSFKLQNQAVENMTGSMNFLNKTVSQSQDSQKMGKGIIDFVVSFFSKPENSNAFARVSEVLPLLIANISHNLAANFTEIQSRLTEKGTHFGRRLNELDMETFNRDIFAIWKEIYESDFQKFFTIPSLGIARNYQEQINSAMDAGNRSYMAFSEFMNLLYLPVENAGASVIDECREMMETEELPDDPKKIYKSWIKTLEGNYMQMLQSTEYTTALNNLINTLAEHKDHRDKVFQSVLNQLQIPTNREMDELYREIYLLKKKINRLERRVKDQEPKQ
ncbi:MAG: poly(R)-hydroxyalkanoic acid synthase subunit PhaE [Desulfobacteraceae bacterium]